MAAYEADLAKQVERLYPGVTYEIISKEPVLGDPQIGGKLSRLDVIRRVKPILPLAQLNVSGDLLRGEEGDYFIELFDGLAKIFETMPHQYQTEGTPAESKIIHLHYFSSASDWYIVERDSSEEQLQAYGYAILNGDLQNAEWGYISIEEMKRIPQVQLDFHWTPKTFKEVMIEKNPGAINSENPGNPHPDELQFKAPLARAEQFMNELRRFGYDVGHDADYEDPANYMTVIIRNVTPGRKRLLLDTAERYAALLKQGDPGPKALPVVTYGGKKYYVDRRLNEIRNVEVPWDIVRPIPEQALSGQIQEQVEYRWEFLPIGQGHYFHAESYERAFYKALEEATRDVVIFQQWKPREQWKYALLPSHMKGWTPEQVIEHYVGQGMDRNMITKVMEGASIFHQGP